MGDVSEGMLGGDADSDTQCDLQPVMEVIDEHLDDLQLMPVVLEEVRRLRVEAENQDACRLLERGLRNGRYIDVVSIAKMVNQFDRQMAEEAASQAERLAAAEEARLQRERDMQRKHEEQQRRVTSRKAAKRMSVTVATLLSRIDGEDAASMAAAAVASRSGENAGAGTTIAAAVAAAVAATTASENQGGAPSTVVPQQQQQRRGRARSSGRSIPTGLSVGALGGSGPGGMLGQLTEEDEEGDEGQGGEDGRVEGTHRSAQSDRRITTRHHFISSVQSSILMLMDAVATAKEVAMWFVVQEEICGLLLLQYLFCTVLLPKPDIYTILYFI